MYSIQFEISPSRTELRYALYRSFLWFYWRVGTGTLEYTKPLMTFQEAVQLGLAANDKGFTVRKTYFLWESRISTLSYHEWLVPRQFPRCFIYNRCRILNLRDPKIMRIDPLPTDRSVSNADTQRLLCFLQKAIQTPECYLHDPAVSTLIKNLSP